MDRYLGRYSTYIYAILRIVVGSIFLLHGTQKLFGYPPMPAGMGGGGSLSTLLLAAAIIEVITGALILVGLFTGLAAFIASGEMAFAYFIAFQSRGFWPQTNGGGEPVVLCFLFLYMAARGSGIWSIDSLRGQGPNPI